MNGRYTYTKRVGLARNGSELKTTKARCKENKKRKHCQERMRTEKKGGVMRMGDVGKRTSISRVIVFWIRVAYVRYIRDCGMWCTDGGSFVFIVRSGAWVSERGKAGALGPG